MRRQLLFVQGGGAHTHQEWDNKLVESLASELGTDFEIRYPRMPDEANPNYARWSTKVHHEFAAMHDDAIVIGHSIGGTILINALAERPPERESAAIFLLSAPFVGEGGWPADDWEPTLALGSKLPPHVPVYIYQGLADDTAPPVHADLYAHAIPHAIVSRLPGRDHQLNNDLREVAAAIKVLSDA